MKSKAGMVAGLLAGATLALSDMGSAQITLPGSGTVPGVLNGVGRTVGGTLQPLPSLDGDLSRLASDRIERLAVFVRNHRGIVEADADGQPARAHELLLLDPDDAALRIAEAAGYRLGEREEIGELGIGFARLEAPDHMSLAQATARLSKMLPGRTITADQLHFPASAPKTGDARAVQGAMARPTGGTVGIIDGGLPASSRLADQAGFAPGAPRPAGHAQAIASLLAGAGVEHIYAADVYGSDPAGGDALAIARALGWMAARGVGVVSISLVGPANPLLARAVAAAKAKGIILVAAVGNDGAAAPPAYPASYPDVEAVTGVDGHGRVLFEAGHALHVDYAAPGADLTAIGLDGRRAGLRGTSFAAPLAAARIAAYRQQERGSANALAGVNAEAAAAGARTGHGIVCNDCRRGM